MTDYSCEDCGFELFLPIQRMPNSRLGLYDDARFPGRCILSLRDHYEHLEDVPLDLSMRFMEVIQHCAAGIRRATGCDRVNVAILGNAVPHVHAHLIPRFGDREALPRKSPWDDPRTRQPLGESAEGLIERIRGEV